MGDFNKVSFNEIRFLSKYYHSKKDSRGSAIFRLAVNIDAFISAILAPNYWKYKYEIHDIDRIVLFAGNFFDLDFYQELLKVYDTESNQRRFSDKPHTMSEVIKEIIIFSDYMCRFNDDLDPSSPKHKIKSILEKTVEEGKHPIKNPQILKLIDPVLFDFSKTEVVNIKSTFQGNCIICENSYTDSNALFSHIVTQHTNFGEDKNPIETGDLYRFIFKIFISHRLEGMICNDYQELCLFALRRFKRMKLSDITDSEIEDTVREVLGSEDFYARGIRMPGAGYSNLRKH